ncbi:MAG: hypothetical protein ACJ74H_01755 [Thermoanaerobaculia bacterium]
MKYAVLALLLSASSAFAFEVAQVSTERLVLRVGETADIGVAVHHVSGLNYTMWRFIFSSDREDVAALDGTLDYQHPVWSGKIHVMARAPGIAQIVSNGKTYTTVEVVCGFVDPIKAVASAVVAKKGEPVKLSLAAAFETGRVLNWYAGRVGDTSHPLVSPNGFDVTVTPAAPGTHYVWVLSTSPCATSSTEFRIDVPAPRRHAVGRR